MNILLTGGTGLIGKALVEQLCLRNEQVTILTRFPNLIHKNSLMPSSILLASQFFIKFGRKTRNLFYEKVV